MNKNLSKFIEDNWDELKQKVHSEWEKLSKEDIEEIAKSPPKLIQKIIAAYGLEAEDVEKAVTTFLSKNGFNTSALMHAGNTIPTFHALSTYAKDNPIKSLGIAALAGFIIARIIS